MRPLFIEAVTISDAWFQLIYNVFDPIFTYEQEIQRGSYANDQIRRQFYSATINIKRPWEDRIPKMPDGMNIPPPCDEKYVDTEYFPNYLMNPNLAPNETYKYSTRIFANMEHGEICELRSGKTGTQVDRVVEMLRETPQTNQATIEIGSPYDLDICKDLVGHCDPPCLRLISFKVLPGNFLQMAVYFRSWDLWAGFPANLAGLELFREWIMEETGLLNGPLVAYSDGLHLYKMYEEVAKIRLHMG